MLDEKLEIKLFVRRVDAVEHQKLVEGLFKAFDEKTRAAGLFVQRLHGRRQKSAKTVGVTFRFGEGGAAVFAGIAQNVRALRMLCRHEKLRLTALRKSVPSGRSPDRIPS